MPHSPTNATRGILLMVAAMAAFAVADTFVKLVSEQLSVPHTLVLLVGGTGLVFCVIAKSQGAALLDRRGLRPLLLVRYLCEIVGTYGLVIAFATVPLSTVGAIIQATPLVVMLGAVMVLGEKVTGTQWAAITVGFVGVLFVVQPAGASFDASVLWAVFAMLGLSGRDLTTRMTPPDMPSALMAAYTMLAALPFALIWALMAEGRIIATSTPWPFVVGMVGCGALAYLVLIASIRAAPVSVVSPFRYTRLIFLMVAGMVVFAERPGIWVYVGSALIVVSGIAAMRLGRASAKNT